MSLDLMVVMKERLSKDLKSKVHSLLIKERFKKEKNGYYPTDGNISLDIYYSTVKDIQWYWRDSALLKDLGFMPKAEVNLESRHTEISHLTSYRLARKIATLTAGIIYDPQVGEFYDYNGKPSKQGGRRRAFKYGSGTALFIKAVGIVDALTKEQNSEKD